jgi:hypothetical protein
VRLVIACAVLAVMMACSRERSSLDRARMQAGHGSLSQRRVQALRARENGLRARYSPNEAPPWLDVSGADPYRLSPVPEAPQPGQDTPARKPADRFVGILRGSKALVMLDADLHELERIQLAEAPTSLCVSSHGALVGSRFSPVVERIGFGVAATPVGQLPVDASGVIDLACGEHGLFYVLTRDPPALLTFEQGGKLRAQRPAMPGGLRLLERGGYLLESSLFERALRISKLDRDGVPSGELARIRHEGPIWAFDALVSRGELWLALSGVEDKALVRAQGEFENIDSCVWLYRYGARGLERVAMLNVGEQGLVVPKAVALTEQQGELSLTVLAAGSGVLLRAHFDRGRAALVPGEIERVPPGASDAVFLDSGKVVYASPLLDAWISRDASALVVRHVDPERRPEPFVRLGEALFFTDLMAPENVSSGTHSRFTCETCHFEGGVDGRTHYTGRADVSVVTKPLFGLANNRPHFSRARDRDLSSVSHNEFRVAGAGSGTDPWFSLQSARFPWLAELGITRGELSALDLREALLQFLYAFSHEPNPRVRGRARFTELEARGARAFEARCEGCHSARLFSDDAGTRVAFSGWEHAIFRRNAPLVWARAEYEKTGVLPYVHERGTRIPSLRRLAGKHRYFTNGSAATLDDVLARFRPGLHDALEQGEITALPEDERRALLAFLALL